MNNLLAIPKKKKSSFVAINRFLLILIFFILLLNISTCLASNNIYEINQLWSGVTPTLNITKIPIVDQNTTLEINISSIDSVTVLPSDKIGLKTLDGKYIINNPEDYPELKNITWINPEKITNVSFSSFESNQKIEKLDKYDVKLIFNNLKGSNDLKEANITNYLINWGDNAITTSDVDTYVQKHTYKKSGTYVIKISANDEYGYVYNYTRNFTVNYEGDLVHTYLVLDENKEEIATTSAGISGIALVGFALTETGKYKLLAMLPLMMPMYTKIQKDDVLDQFVRGEIYGLVKTNPGVHYNEIMKKLDMKNGTLSYHLHMLEKMEMIKSRKEGIRYRAFYPTGMRFPEEERYRLTDFQLEILNIIKENEGIQQKDIAKKLGKKPQTINYNIKTLQQAGLIKVRKRGRETSCYILNGIIYNQNQPP